MRATLTLVCLTAVGCSLAQDIYFPPLTGNTWSTVDPASLGWCTEQIPPLLTYLGDNDTKAFIVLKDGRIAIEQYYGTFTQDSLWYWASAGKSLTAFLVGKAQEDGFLDIDQPSSDFLGTGWTSCTPTQEAAITIRHQLTMTTGLDDGTGDTDCTDPTCLQYLADPGTRWAYHNAAYTKLDGVITAATGQSINAYLLNKLTLTTGLQGAYVGVDYNNVFFSKARHFARFGLLAMAQGQWNGTSVMADANYFNEMVSPSQGLNEAYGYLWWLNGQDSYMVPGLQLQLPGLLVPNEPPDAYNALGKNGQILCVVPSQGLVVVRMGNPPDASVPVPYLLTDEIWQRLNLVLCGTTALPEATDRNARPSPIPASDHLVVPMLNGYRGRVQVIGLDGREQEFVMENGLLDTSMLTTGLYTLRCTTTLGETTVIRFEVAR